MQERNDMQEMKESCRKGKNHAGKERIMQEMNESCSKGTNHAVKE